MNPKTDALLDEIARLEVIVTDSVIEALALENNLIKTRSPRYNILLRDDKNYPYLQLTTGERFPRVLVARRVEKDDHFYAGPFLPARFARRTMALTHRLFGIRSCNEVITGKRGRPCLEYDIKRCIAPCVDTICSEEDYQRAVEDTRLFLEGRTEELAGQLRERMEEASGAERFEQAAQLRDAMRTVETLTDRHQKMASPDLGARDVFGLRLGPAGTVIQIFQVRGGRVVDRIELSGATGLGVMSSEGDVVATAISQFYENTKAPPEVHVPGDGGRARGARSPGSAIAPDAACASSCPGAARRRACSSWPRATRRSPTTHASTPRRWATTRRSRRCATCWRSRRCRAGSTASTSPRSRAARRSPRWWSAKTAG